VTKCYTVEFILFVKNQKNMVSNGGKVHIIYIVQTVGLATVLFYT